MIIVINLVFIKLIVLIAYWKCDAKIQSICGLTNTHGAINDVHFSTSKDF